VGLIENLDKQSIKNYFLFAGFAQNWHLLKQLYHQQKNGETFEMQIIKIKSWVQS